ncbi:MAG: response regulator [Myxococcales bacterium]|nr:response regulator [Myxococcales bacterium]
MSDPRWAPVLHAFEDLREHQRTTGEDRSAGMERLAAMIEERAGLLGHLDVSESAAQFLEASAPDLLDAGEVLLHHLRELVFKCRHRQGPVLVVAGSDTHQRVHRQLAGLEHRVLRTDAQGVQTQLDEGPVAAVIVEVADSPALDLLARLRVDPRCEPMPIVAIAGSEHAGECRALGAAAVVRVPLGANAVGGCMATLLGQDNPVVRAFTGDVLPDHRAFARSATKVISAARGENGTYCLLLAAPLNLENARKIHGPVFARQVQEASAAALRDVLGDMARVHALDQDLLAWISRAERGALQARLERVTSGDGRPVPTPDGGTWFNRLCIAGVEVDGEVPLPRAIQGARRMLGLAHRAGGGAPVITPLEDRGRDKPSALVFEPDASVAETLTRELERAGFDVTRPEEIMDALARVRSQPFDLILTAVDGPGAVKVVSGFRKLSGRTTVLAITPDAGSARAALQHGADDIVSKPVDGSIFAARLRARLRAP